MSPAGSSAADRGSPAPAWLGAAAAAATLLALAQLAWELLVLRPGWGLGDESYVIRRFVSVAGGGPVPWHWAQGSLSQALLMLWLGLSGDSLGALHAPSFVLLCLEALLLWRLAARWISKEAAAWALLADFLCADTWMRDRSFLSHAWLPVELLALAWASGAVRGRGSALLWGLAASALVMDYDGGLVALPVLGLACLAMEREFRGRWPWVLGAFLAGLLALASRQMGALRAYVGLRAAVNLGTDRGILLASWLRNLWQLLAGGEPVPYLGVDHWPAMAAWCLPLLALGAWEARRKGRRSLLLWAAFAVLLTQADRAPWGLPIQRLAAAWPALCLLAGLGGASLRARLPRVPALAWILCLLLGTGLEANAFYRHMAFHGRQVFGNSALLAQAARDSREAQAQGASISTALMETRSSTLRFLVAPSTGGAPLTWVFLPPEFHAAAAALGETRVYRDTPNDLPVLVLLARGAQAQRFLRVEASLRPLLDRGASNPDLTAWPDAPAPTDAWAYDAVLDRRFRSLWQGAPLDQDLMRALVARPPVTAGPLDLLGRYLLTRDPASALKALDRALALDPDWGPALSDRVQALRALGREQEAGQAAQHRDESFQRGVWLDYD
jgi:hypothetical protein